MKILNFKNAFHQKALSKVKQFKKQEDAKDLNLEHNLLIESADREERLASQLNTLELDLNKTKQELERVYNENEKIVISHQELSNLNEQLKDNMLKQRNEIKSLKERENRLLVDNTDLDGENVQLQEQIAKLKEDLVELDTIRHENKALEEKLETLESQIVELTTLKKIVEKQLEESLNSFREEREHKYQRKRESHERREKQSLQELKNLANNLADENIHERLLYENIDIDDDEFDDQKNMGTLNEQILSRGSSTSSRNSQHEPVASSLFNEIHSDEMQTLEKKIEEINKGKDLIEVELNEFKADLNLLLVNIQSMNKKLPHLNAAHENKELDEIKLNSLDDGKVNKQALSLFDKLKNDLEVYFTGNEKKNYEELAKKIESLKNDNNYLNDNLVSYFLFSYCQFLI